jgi:hypothetical protein
VEVGVALVPLLAGVVLVGAGVLVGAAVLAEAGALVAGAGAVVAGLVLVGAAGRNFRTSSMPGCTADDASGTVSQGVTKPALTTAAASPEVHSHRLRGARCRPAELSAHGEPARRRGDEPVSRSDRAPVGAEAMCRK